MSAKISEMKITYTQEDDCCQPDDGIQGLEMQTQDGGGGIYYVIKTERWAFDSLDDLIDVMKDFISKAKMINEQNLEVSDTTKSDKRTES